MQLHSNVSLDEGRRNLERMVRELSEHPSDFNEANTRFHIIDRILIDCLGWPRHLISTEGHHDGEYRDYVLGSPPSAIWEAKREGIYFDFPADVRQRTIQDLKSIFATTKEGESAIRQVQGYCNSSGIEIGVVCNGGQLAAFVAQTIGRPWIDGKALIIHSPQKMLEEFGLIWQCLSPDGVLERRLISILTSGSIRSIPPKLSARLVHFPQFRYKNEIQANLRAISELLLEDLVSVPSMRSQFYRECYCETGALSRDALISAQILQARYASLFPASEDAPQLEPAASVESTTRLSQQVVTEALARRPIVLLGDVGVGKTSFLEELMFVRASKEFNNVINIYIDLGSKAALSSDLKAFVIDEVERQVYGNYNIDFYNHDFVRGVYDIEVKRFRSSFKAAVYKSNKQKLDEEIAKRIAELTEDKPEHLRRSIQHVARARRRQIVVMIDNADQRAIDIQQEAFILAQDFAQNWDALVFIAVRPQTFFQSKRAGALSAYPHKVFTILPPRPELVIEKRLRFALNIAEGRMPAERLQGVRLDIENMALFLRALLYSLEHNRDLTEILANITGGNIRKVVEFITGFIGSPNVEARKIIEIQRDEGKYVIPLHEFSKAAILGDYSHFVPDTSLAMNIFDAEAPDIKEHFLSMMILSFLMAATTEKDRDEFVRSNAIIEEMQAWGFVPDQTERALRRLTNKRLIETTERITFEEDLVGLIGDMPDGFRATSVGAYHMRRWAGSFGYLDAMVFDTPIFDSKVVEEMVPRLMSFDIEDRFTRTLLFRNYLSAAWDASALTPAYFDWNEIVSSGAANFRSVRGVIERRMFARQQGGPRHRR